MLRNAASIYEGLLVSHNLVVFCAIPSWVMEGIQQAPNILPARANIEMSPAHLVLVGSKVLPVFVLWLSCLKVTT